MVLATFTLVFEPDNPWNTNIFDSDDGRIMYHVVTMQQGPRTVTRIDNSVGDTIASLEWRERTDIITLGHAPPVSVSTWLRKSVVPFKDTVTFQDPLGRSFKWKGTTPGLQLELYAENDKKHPIAKFLRSRRTINTATNPPTQAIAPAQLLLDSRGEEIMDLVIISFLVLEKTRRSIENST